MSMSRKYAYFCNSDHHLASSDGVVYCHRVAAEKLLGRRLKPGEVVHHIDENKFNNTLSNLLVFATRADHTSYHRRPDAKLKLQDDGAYTCDRAQVTFCINCGKELFRGTVGPYCGDCRVLLGINRKVKHRPGKQELYELLQTNSFTAVGKMYAVSSSTIKKWCINYNIPSHARDYK